MRQMPVNKKAPVLDRIAAEVHRLSPGNGASLPHVEELLRELAEAESTPAALRPLARQALATALQPAQGQ